MLGRFSNALQQAADVLAPPPPLYEDFVYYWKKVMNHYLDVSKTKPIPIEMTNIPNHLEQLLKILLKEEEDSEGVGACLEYFLQHNLLDLMVTLASSDDPPGMKQHILQFISKFVSQTKTLAIGHSNVYLPLQRLVGLCDGATPTPCERHEIQFLLSLSAVLRRNSQLVPLFVTNSVRSSSSCSTGECPRRASFSSSVSVDSEPSLPNNPLFTTPLVSSARASTVTLIPVSSQVPASSSPTTPPSDAAAFFSLADSVLSYIDSPDTEVRLKACQAILLMVSLPQGSKVASLYAPEAALKLVSRLVLLYFTIPHSTEPTHVDDTHTSWGLDIPTNMECSGCDGCKQAATFLSWLDFCDQVMIEGAPEVAVAVSRKIADSFLGQAFTVTSLQRPVTLTLLIKCFKMASSSNLNSVLNEWLCREEVLRSLLQNWTSEDTELALETLRLFELVLEKGDSDVLYRLVLRYLNNRNYLDNTIDHHQEEVDLDCVSKENPETAKDIDSIIKLWRWVVPEEVQSSGGGYDEYLAESLRQYRAVLAKTSTPTAALTTDPQQSQGQFEEGPFLKTLFDCLANIPNQVYEVNLELTGVVSRLALRPEPPITEYLLDPTVQVCVSVHRRLRELLSSVAAQLAPSITQLPNYRQTLSQVRLSLLSGSLTSLPLRTDPWRTAFENIVVIEELCKELAAITHVKLKSSSSVQS